MAGSFDPFVVGFSIPLTAVGKTTKKKNTIRVAIADVFGVGYNSYMFLDEASLMCHPPVSGVPTIMPVVRPTSTPSYSQAPSRSPIPFEGDFKVDYTGITAAALAKKMAGNGVTITAANLTQACAGESAGFFKGGKNALGALDTGTVLSSGYLFSLMDGKSGDCRSPGYEPLDDALRFDGFTEDATILSIEFTCDDKESDFDMDVNLDFIFGSFEYYGLTVNATYDNRDIVGMFLNDDTAAGNIAIANDKTVDVKSIPRNNSLYVDRNNVNTATTIPPLHAGHTQKLQASGRTELKNNILKIAIADVNDYSVDSFVFIQEGSLKCKIAAATADTCTAPSKKCDKSFECCQNRFTTECRNDECSICEVKEGKCRKDSQCCSASGGLVARCDENNRCIHCIDDGDKCDNDIECCSAKCKDGKCKLSRNVGGNNRERPSRRKRERPNRKRNRERPSRNRKRERPGRSRPKLRNRT
jgi:hypothetical protein